MWYDPRDTLSKGRLFNFDIGARGCGKTTGTVKFGVDRKLKKPEFEIAWVRRYDTERKAIKPQFFDGIKSLNFFENSKLEIKGNTGTLNGERFINFLALSKDGRTKGITSPNIELIVFDEFLIDKSGFYLTSEVERFLSLYDTIARPSDPRRKRVPVLFLANAMSLTNPYFLYFNVRFNPNGVFKNQSIFAQILQDSEFTEQAQQSEFAKLIAGSRYAEHSIGNKFLLDNNDFVEKKSEKAKNFCNFKYGGKWYGLWIEWDEGKVWCSYKYDPSSLQSYVLMQDDMQPNLLSAKFFKTTYQYNVVKTAFNSGGMFFEDVNIKNTWYKILKMMNV